ncbi:hypothetical protein NHX12_018288 [Muraenolepis orangiensis]|uniref:Ubinuclein middle domain-containing protein n=1 Tax=Muraenolepis orangiensis TaxID=630683 RepID=A0A9Q0F0M5_9TELE|nr:hypothetical protein NHX12_018288 [Muraenolepis orangiensis]
MAEPRKVQLVTLSTFAAGSATDSRRRRLEHAADVNLDGDGEGDAATWADGGGSAGTGRFGKTDKDAGTDAIKTTVRLDLKLPEPSDHSSVELNYVELIKNHQAKNKPPTESPAPDPNDPFSDEERDRLQMEATAKKLEKIKSNTGKKRKDRMQDLIDLGFGYDETDPFIDNSEAYDELVPASLSTKLGGFYINTGTLQFRAASESEGEDVSKDPLALAAMIRRFTREKEEMRKRNPAFAHPHLSAKPNHFDLSLADITGDPAVMALLASANEKELQDLLGVLDFGQLDATPQDAVVVEENGLMGVRVSKAVAASGVQGGGGSGGIQGRRLSAAGGVFYPPPLPDELPASLIKRFSIELQVQEQPPEVRYSIYSHMEAFVPCNKEALLKRLKKLALNIQDDRLRTPLLELKLAVCSVMPEQIARYNMDCMAKIAKQQVTGPRKKFIWDDKLRTLLCSLVLVKLSCFELEKTQLSVEDYLKAFMENEVKPLWPKGWMQARILLKESRAVHSHLTGNLLKRRVQQGPRAKAKEVLWIQNPAFPMNSTLGASTSLTTPSGRHLPLPSPAEPICLSDSLDDDLTAPNLDSISQALALLSSASVGLGVSPPPLQLPISSYVPFSSAHTTAAMQHSLVKMESTVLAGRASLPIKPGDGLYGLMKGAPGQHQRLVTVATLPHRRPSVMMGVVNKLHSHPSPLTPKQRPPPTTSPLLRPHQKGFSGSAGPLGPAKSSTKSSAKSSPKSSAKPPADDNTVSSSSNGGSMGGGMPPPSRSNPLPLPRPTLQSYGPPVMSCSSHTPSPSLSSHTPPTKPQHHQSNFITPLQATLTKSSHSSNSSIIKLTPRPPTPSPASPPSSSLSQPQILSSAQQQHLFSQKAQGFRPTYSISTTGVQAKQGQPIYSFAAGNKTQAISPGKSPSPSSSSLSTSVLANHGQRQRSGGGAHQGSKAGNERVVPGMPSPSHLAQVSSLSGAGLLGSPSTLPLGFGMLGGLVPVSLPFQFPSLINFSSPPVPGMLAGLGTAANSGFSQAQNELLDANQSQGSDMNRESH